MYAETGLEIGKWKSRVLLMDAREAPGTVGGARRRKYPAGPVKVRRVKVATAL